MVRDQGWEHCSKGHNNHIPTITLATWNIRTLVENAGGDRRICRSRPGPNTQVHEHASSPHCVDRKLDFLVGELRRLGVAVAGIQETKWFGSDIWTADGYTLLHSGRSLPEEGDPQVRNEGVGILLDKDATAAWKDAGESWDAISSRVVKARLKVARSGQRRPGGSRMTSDIYMSVVSAYAPTAKAPPGVKAKFFEELQDGLNSIPAGDTLVVLGDFNARVGRRERANDVWRAVRGKHGIGTCNEPGEQFLEFCSLNNLTIMNTWFEKPQVHMATWKHPATKQPHMIDFMLMRSGQRRLCQDVRVCRSACCWTDHYMVRGKIQLQLPRAKKKSVAHAPLAVHTLRSEECRENFQQNLSQRLMQHPHSEGGLLEDNWEQLKQCILESAEECVGRAKKKQPDWFLDAASTLMPLVTSKHRAYNKFLQTPTTETKKEFRKQQKS